VADSLAERDKGVNDLVWNVQLDKVIDLIEEIWETYGDKLTWKAAYAMYKNDLILKKIQN
jgi:hypothetical protein